jgi:hypothetical protein
MAGYTSTARKYGEYIQPYNIDLIAKGLSFKQGQYDAADAKIRSKITEIEGMDLMKAEDKQHLLNNLKSMLGDINAVGALDLSNSDVTRALESHISQSIDDKVMNAYSSTKEIRNFQQKMQEMEAKGVKEGGYHPDNMAYAMRFVSDYLNDGKVGSKLSDYGSLVYRPFVDVNKKVDEILDQLKGRGDGMIETVGPDGVTMIKKDMNSMTPEEVMNLVSAHLTPDMQEQLKITTWAKMGGGKTPESQAFYQQQLGNYQNTLTKRLNDQKTSLTSALAAKDITNEQRTLIQNNLSNIETELSSLPQRMQMLAQNFEQGAMAMGVDEYLSRATAQIYPVVKGKGMYSTGEYSKIHEKNTEWAFKEHEKEMGIKRLELDYAKHNLDLQKFELEKEEHEYKRANGLLGRGGSSSSSSSSGGKDGNGGDGGSEPVVTDDVTEYDDGSKSFKWQYHDEIGKVEKDYDSKMNVAFDYFMGDKFQSPEDSQASAALKIRYASLGGKYNKYDKKLWQKVWNEMGDKFGITDIYDRHGNVATSWGDIDTQKEAIKTMKSIREEAQKKSPVFEKESTHVFGEPFFKIVSYPSSNPYLITVKGEDVPVRDYLIRKGILDKNGNKLKEVDAETARYLRNNSTGKFKNFIDEEAGRAHNLIFSDNKISSEDKKVESALYRDVLKNLANNRTITFSNPTNNEKAFVLSLRSGDKPLSDSVDPSNITAVRYVVNSLTGEISAKVSVKKKGSRDEGNSVYTVDIPNVNKDELYRNVPWFERNVKRNLVGAAYQQKIITRSGGIESGPIRFFSSTASPEREFQLSNSISGLGLGPQEQSVAIAGLTKDGMVNALASRFTYENSQPLYIDILKNPTLTSDEQKQAIAERQQGFVNGVQNLASKIASGNYKLKVSPVMGNNGTISIVDSRGNTVSKMIYPNIDDYEKVARLIKTSSSSALTVYINDIITRELANKGTGPLSQTFTSIFNL